jgi:hypothetical protein
MLAQVNYKFQFYALFLIDSSCFSCNSLKFTAHAYLIHAALLIPTISREQKIHLKYFSMEPPSVSRGRKRQRGREEEGNNFGQGDLGIREPQQGGGHRQRDNAHEPGAPFLPFLFI